MPTLPTRTLTKLQSTLETLAHQAGTHIQSRVGHHGPVQTKQGGHTLSSQVVTEVDREVQNLICQALEPISQEHNFGLLAEESEDNQSRLQSDYFWCIDPIDGTLPFIEGAPGYSVSLALVNKSGQSVLGVVHDPITQKTYSASQGAGASINETPLRVLGEDPNNQNQVIRWYCDRSFPSDPIFNKVQDRLKEAASALGFTNIILRSDGASVLNACWSLENAPAVYFKFPKPQPGGGSFWDFAASSCIAKEAGSIVSDIWGQDLNLNTPGSTFMNHCGVAYASTSALAKMIYDLYQEFA